MPLASLLSFFSLVLFLLLCIPQSVRAQSDIYRWVDDKGVQHFSDTPPQQRKAFVTFPKHSSQSRPSPVVSEALQAETTPIQAEVPLAAILAPKEKEDFARRGISLDQKVLILFDDTY